MVEEELIEAQRRTLHKEHMEHKEHKEHKKHKEHMTMMLYFLRKCSQIANGQCRDDYLVGETNYLHKVPSEPGL